MNKQQKELQVDKLKQDFLSSQASFLVSYKGMTVSKMQELRRELRAVGGKLTVAKMRLVKKAVEADSGMQELIPYLKEQLGVVFSKEEAPGVAKVLYTFAKNNEKLGLVIGTLEKKLLNKKDIEFIATIPSREVLLAQLCFTLKASIIQTIMTLDAISKKLSSETQESSSTQAAPEEEVNIPSEVVEEKKD